MYFHFFLLVFAALFLFALAITVIAEFTDVKWVEKIIRVGEGLGRVTFVAIAITFILVEGIPMLAAWYKREMRIKGREEGRAENQRVWKLWLEELEAWEQRKASTESDGKTFTEPRPCPPSDD